MKLDYNLEVENFDAYFLKKISELPVSKREGLPIDLLGRVFNTTGLSTKTISFFQKIYLLQRAFNKRIFIHIEDNETGIGIEDFLKFKQQFKKRETTISESEEMISKGVMVLSGEDLVNHLYHKNKVSTSNAYKFSLKLKNVRPHSRFNYRNEFNFFSDLLIKYEAAKKKILKEKGLTTPELFVLLFLYDGTEKKSASAYNGAFTNTFNAGRSHIITALRNLRERGYVEGCGKAKNRTYRITSLGKDVTSEIIFKYIATV